MEKINEECAVFGVSLNAEETANEAAGITYNGLLALQHRGQEGAGIAVVGDGVIHCRKALGLVGEIFSKDNLSALPQRKIAVGHTRYSTTGGIHENNAGPFVIDFLTGRIAVSHNGNVVNSDKLREELRSLGLRFDATSDSEVASSLIAYRIMQEKDEFSGIVKACDELEGAYSLAIATGGGRLIAVRDPNGYRPLCIGKNASGIAIASESCALDACGFNFVRDVEPGEVVVIENAKIIKEGVVLKNNKRKNGLCIFEYVYFARPDSVIDGLNVYEARLNMGKTLWEEASIKADLICGVPDSGLEAAEGYSKASGIPLASGFVKNRYIGRSFIYPTQIQRDSAVRLKLNPLAQNIEGKKIVLVDDSIVRGTTSERIVKSLKSAGAKEVHMRISSPKFVNVCNYGTDIDSKENLIANKMNEEEIRRKIGADSLAFISVNGLKSACSKAKLGFCAQCFTPD